MKFDHVVNVRVTGGARRTNRRLLPLTTRMPASRAPPHIYPHKCIGRLSCTPRITTHTPTH